MTRRSFKPALVALVAAATLTACGSATNSSGPFTFAASATGAYKAASITLTDTAGAPFDLATTTHTKLTLVFFGYTHCPDECPAVMSQVASGFTRLSAAQKADITMVFITTDPAQDSGPVIRAWLNRYDPTFVGVTGPIDRTIALADSLKLFVHGATRLPSGGWDVPTHDTHVVALNDKHIAVAMWGLDTTSKQYAADITALLNGEAPQ